MNGPLRGIAVGVLGVAMLAGVGCTAKVDPAQMSRIEAAANQATAAANKAQSAASNATAAAQEAAEAAQKADAAAQKAAAGFSGSLRK